MCPRDREEPFHLLPALAERFIASHLNQSSDVMVKAACAVPWQSKTGPAMSDAPSQLGEISGLSKSEAEDLLDLLEAAGYELCQLTFVDGEGFSVRPSSPT
jgi:hypothetical protein